MNFKICLLFCATLVNGGILKHHIVLTSEESTTDDGWWKNAIFYQIYPRSFMDSDGDGYGDLQGIISKLDHLKDMGIDAAWLSPIYPSPGVDQGYDISDYRDVDPMFGNLSDLKELIEKAHELGIKIIMDFVPNHTSDKHDWFLQSVAKNDTFADFYIWKDGGTDGVPPNNWISIFGDSAWTYSDTRKQFYLHQFASAQPDLNYRNPAVVKAMKEVLIYWLDFGVDGFRMDAVPYLFEDENFPDEPLSGADGMSSNQYGYLKHIYTSNLEQTYDMIYQFRAVLDNYNRDKNVTYSRIMMTEAYTKTMSQTFAYYGNNTVDGAHFTFNFNLITSDSSADNIINAVNKWLSNIPQKYVSNWVLGNHDQHRVASRLGIHNVDALNMLTAFLPGIQVTYMGEEIGMEDGAVTCGQGHDPQAIKNCSTFNETSRDFERTPYQWDSSFNAGFSKNSTTWLPVSEKYKTTNLLDGNSAKIRSHYNVYKSMVQFRQHFKGITHDEVALLKLSDDVMMINRTTNKGEFVYLFNSGNGIETVNVHNSSFNFVVLVTDVNSQFSMGDNLPQSVTLMPHECIILKAQSTSTSSAMKAFSSTLMGTVLFIVFMFK
ncbi:unnamed protein product [Ceutorhynchus assimilis]|uniref:alpha-glucosidase n=1 Tax=Ceutorhynchus assimilis TaxID=467358 RepID=A0A9N9ME40_9CUCU|nr:unnamed protein product [Ceutorhynchus assimilis]